MQRTASRATTPLPPRGLRGLPRVLLLALAFGAACGSASEEQPPSPLAPDAAARLAAKLANDECERLYDARPFSPDQHAVTEQAGRLTWGRLDLAAPAGYSATVSFRPDGTDPRVSVQCSTDAF